MPAFAFSRQPEAPAWFGSARARSLLAQERGVAEEWLKRRPSQPVLWLAVVPETPSVHLAAPGTRRLSLWRTGDRFEGDVRCELPLPLASESFGSLVVQHCAETAPVELLDECARVLAPGGRLLLFALNPMSPFRLRWRGHGLRVHDIAGWQEQLRRMGLQPRVAVGQYLGPLWRRTPQGMSRLSANRLRAVCVLEGEKRVAALIPPAPARRGWNTGTAPA